MLPLRFGTTRILNSKTLLCRLLLYFVLPDGRSKILFHRLTRNVYLYNGCLALYNVVLTSRIHSSVKCSQASTLTAAVLCDGGISVLNHCLSWSKFVNTHLCHCSQWFNIGPTHNTQTSLLRLRLVCQLATFSEVLDSDTHFQSAP